MELVRKCQEAGILIGSCSDRPISGQKAIWEQYGIASDFAGWSGFWMALVLGVGGAVLQLAVFWRPPGIDSE